MLPFKTYKIPITERSCTLCRLYRRYLGKRYPAHSRFRHTGGHYNTIVTRHKVQPASLGACRCWWGKIFCGISSMRLWSWFSIVFLFPRWLAQSLISSHFVRPQLSPFLVMTSLLGYGVFGSSHLLHLFNIFIISRRLHQMVLSYFVAPIFQKKKKLFLFLEVLYLDKMPP